eukprot:4114427-Pyramimonas_sp.AAC.1
MQQYAYIAACETHVGATHITRWKKQAREAAFKLFPNPARPKSKWITKADPSSNEGGGVLFACTTSTSTAAGRGKVYPGPES